MGRPSIVSQLQSEFDSLKAIVSAGKKVGAVRKAWALIGRASTAAVKPGIDIAAIIALIQAIMAFIEAIKNK